MSTSGPQAWRGWRASPCSALSPQTTILRGLGGGYARVTADVAQDAADAPPARPLSGAHAGDNAPRPQGGFLGCEGLGCTARPRADAPAF